MTTYDFDFQKEPCWICKRTLADIKKEVPELNIIEEFKMDDPSIKWSFAVCPICAELIESVASKWHIDVQYIEEWFMPIIIKLFAKYLKEVSEK